MNAVPLVRCPRGSVVHLHLRELAAKPEASKTLCGDVLSVAFCVPLRDQRPDGGLKPCVRCQKRLHRWTARLAMVGHRAPGAKP